MAWLQARLHEGSTWKGLLSIIVALATHFLTGVGWQASAAAGAAVYPIASTFIPDKVA